MLPSDGDHCSQGDSKEDHTTEAFCKADNSEGHFAEIIFFSFIFALPAADFVLAGVTGWGC